MKKLVIYGAGDTGRFFVRKLRREGSNDFEVAGFVDDFKKGEVDGLPIFGGREEFPGLREKGIDSVMVSLLEVPIKRLKVCLELEKLGFEFPSVCGSNVLDASGFGKGVYVHESAVLFDSDMRIGDFSVVGPFVTLEGRTTLGRGVILCPYAFVGYGAKIGDGSVVKPRGSVSPNICVGRECVIGPHVLQTKSLADGKSSLRYRAVR